ncbi:MAG: exonuclease subunit SbcD [Saprospiraceae bacterium]
MIKILHTADWHIGKVLHKYSLREDMLSFFDWLIKLIKKEKIDVLLVSGDVFDLANPGARERADYYKILSRLINEKIKVIITGGNHDGIGVLDAPKEVLNTLNINVIGGAKKSLEEEIITIVNNKNEVELVVAAVPFLRDRDLRNLTLDLKYESRIEAIRQGIKSHYLNLGDFCEKQYQGIPAVAMGHLYAKGVSTSESERDIHIGNAVAVESSIFPSCFGYVALGHIHRPQVIGKNEKIRYSGSPIPLSFSEREDRKGVILLNLDNGEFSPPHFIEVSKQRELKRMKGDYNVVSKALKEYNPTLPLPSFVELEFEEEVFNTTVSAKINDLVTDYKDHDLFKILKHKINFKIDAKDTSQLFKKGENIEDLTPKDVFIKRIEQEELDSNKKSDLLAAFGELLEMVESNEL